MKASGSVRLFNLFGIEIRIHLSIFLLLIYFMFVLTAQFPIAVSDAGLIPSDLRQGPYFWAGVLSVSLLVSILLHELGHALVAQSFGIKVRSITLMLLGGVSVMEKSAKQPYAELKLAIAGPAVSFGIVGVMALAHSLSDLPDIIFFTYWLGTANFILAIFNLLPAFPLDGGRVLRSFLAVRQGNIKATDTVVKVSKYLAIGLGIFAVFGFNIILLIISFLIYTASQNERFFVLSQGLLRGLRAKEFGIKTGCVYESQKVGEATTLMLKNRHTTLPVKTDSGASAIVTLNQIMNVPKNVWKDTIVSQVMEQVSKSVEMDDPISQVLPDLFSTPAGALPLKENGNPIGIIRYSDLTEILELRTIEESLTENPRLAANENQKAA